MVEFKRLWFLTVQLELKGPHGGVGLSCRRGERGIYIFQTLGETERLRVSAVWTSIQPLDRRLFPDFNRWISLSFLTWFGGFLDVLGLGWVGLGWIGLGAKLRTQRSFEGRV
ncbi:Hypothetical predicted protein [Prunus dulcis]|uniref:Uncharacterized protein n=1 Tax=Prunus dulcis TaxID=3755 RepID=A0A5E4EBB7_PRUDU|nr:Hypothetical predicted protein [Prunus dulcis]